MDDQERLTIRTALAKAQGWKHHPLVPGDGSVWMGPKDEPAKVPDPFTSANDLLVLLEWLLRQEWMGAWTCYPYCDGGICVVINRRGGSAGNVIASIMEPTFQEALTLAIYRALQEVEKNGK